MFLDLGQSSKDAATSHQFPPHTQVTPCVHIHCSRVSPTAKRCNRQRISIAESGGPDTKAWTGMTLDKFERRGGPGSAGSYKLAPVPS